MSQQNLAPFIWNIADLLLGAFKPSEYGRIILPFTVLRRLECVLEPTRRQVQEQYAALQGTQLDLDLVFADQGVDAEVIGLNIGRNLNLFRLRRKSKTILSEFFSGQMSNGRLCVRFIKHPSLLCSEK